MLTIELTGERSVRGKDQDTEPIQSSLNYVGPELDCPASRFPNRRTLSQLHPSNRPANPMAQARVTAFS